MDSPPPNNPGSPTAPRPSGGDGQPVNPSVEMSLPDGVAAGRSPHRTRPGAAGDGRRIAAGGGLTPDGRFRSGKLAGMTMGAAIWILSWPIMTQSFLNSLVGLTDTVLAAGLSEAATDAIGGASYFIWFIGLVLTAIGVGATALVSRSIGGGRKAVANACLGQAIILSMVSGVVVGVLLVLAAGPATAMLNMGPEAAAAFRKYLYINAAGVPISAILFVGIECIRAAGDSLRPLRAMIAVNIVNILVSWALAGVDITATRMVDGELVSRVVLANPFPFDLGVTGIALGTLAGHALGSAMTLRLLLTGESGVVLLRRRMRPHWHTMRRLVRVGLPNFLEMLGMWVGNFAVVLMVGWLTFRGAAGGVLGAHIVAIRIEAFSFLPGFAMGAAAATLAGQYLGAGSPAMAKRATFLCTAIAAAIMGAIGVMFLTIPGPIVGLLSAQATHLELVPRVLFVAGFVQIPFAIAIVLRSAMRGAGDVKVVMWLTWIATWGVRLPLAYALSGVDIPVPAWLWWGEGAAGGVIRNPFWTDGGLLGLWIGLCVELTIRAAMFAVRFFQGGWLRAKV